MSNVQLLILLIAAHALCDLPLQGEFLSNAKQGKVEWMPAWLALFYHAAIHAGAVLLITNSTACAIGELAFHWLTDAAKCRGLISGKVDQGVHIACKLVWLGVFWWGTSATSTLSIESSSWIHPNDMGTQSLPSMFQNQQQPWSSRIQEDLLVTAQI